MFLNNYKQRIVSTAIAIGVFIGIGSLIYYRDKTSQQIEAPAVVVPKLSATIKATPVPQAKTRSSK